MSEIYWLLALKIHPGKLDPFKAVAAELIALAQEEPETLNYEWTLTDDGQFCHIYERYTGSEAIKLHASRNGPLVGRLFALADPVSFYIYGSPDEEIRRDLAVLKPVYLSPLGGFRR